MNLKTKTHGNIATRRYSSDFEAETTLGKIHFHEWLGDSWGLFSHPADFTPVCTTELGTANYYPEFVKRNTKVIALSVDGLESHLKWIKDIEEVQNVTLQYL
jgi:alkyl hydroperoxide reductase subunit AhpC